MAKKQGKAKTMKMTAKQQRFADEYLIDHNATQAAIRAGYSEKTANEQGARLLVNVSIRAYVNERRKALQDDSLATAYEVEAMLTATMRGELEAEVVVIEGKGKGVTKARRINKRPDHADRIKAAMALAKRHGLLEPKEQKAAAEVVFEGEGGLADE